MKIFRTASMFILGILFLCITGFEGISAVTLYKSENLELVQLTESTIVHISYLQTEDYGKVACNGLIYINNNEMIVVDTPADSLGTAELIQWVKNDTEYQIKFVVPTHFHHDCLAGLDQFHQAGVPSYANAKTIEAIESSESNIPQNQFEGELALQVGGQKVLLFFPGEGHTKDNIVCYVPEEKVLFGGCLIKALNAGKGFTGDANLTQWSYSVENVKSKFPEAEHVIPGHGDSGDPQLLDFTIEMFR